MRYVELWQIRDHLRIDHCDDDNWLDLMIQSASSLVKNYLKDAPAYEPVRDGDDNPILDSDGMPEIDEDSSTARRVRWEVKAAVMLQVGEWYMNRGTNQTGVSMGFLSPAVTSILYPLRDPTCR
jgi:hypothetical protein